MNIFLTGGTGFIGSHFINEAHARGHDIVALRRPGRRPRVPCRREPFWIEGELSGDHSAAMRGIDAFVHLASHSAHPPYDEIERCMYWNVFAATALADQAKAAGVDRFLIAGSSFEYGKAAERYARIPTDAPLEPELSYPISKAAASRAFLRMARESRLRLQLLRVFQVYGDGEQPGRFWPSLRDAALSGRDFKMSPGEQVRDFVAVQEVARQFVEALAFEGVRPGEPVVRHVGSGRPETLLHFARRWWSIWEARGELRAGALPLRQAEAMRLVPEL